jgi:hypothetical protein
MRLLSLVLLLCSITAFSQAEFKGTVYSGAYLKPVSDIYVRSGIRSTKTDYKGNFSIPLTEGEPLQLSNSKYHTQEIPYARLKDRTDMKFYLTPSSSSYSEVITSNPVQTVRAVDFENIFDYTFLTDTLIVLSYMKSKLSGDIREAYLNCALTALRYGEVIDRQILPDYIKKLHLDPYDQLFLEGSDFCHIVLRGDEKLKVESFDLSDFYDRIEPIYALDSNKVYYAYTYDYIPQVSHRIYYDDERNSFPMRFIKNKNYFKQLPGDYEMLEKAEIEEARRMEEETGINHYLFSTYIRSFYLLRDIAPPYAPGFKRNKTIYIFDHMNQWLFSHDLEGAKLDSVGIYHDALNREELVEILQDPFNEKIYAHHERSGVHYIRKVDMNTGASGRPYKIYHPFAERVKIFEGYVYYIHSTPKNKSVKHLLREKLPF